MTRNRYREMSRRQLLKGALGEAAAVSICAERGLWTDATCRFRSLCRSLDRIVSR